MNKAIFLDRDGTINVDPGYVYKIDDLKLIDGTVDALKLFSENGYKLIVISNQSGIGRGFFALNDCNEFNKQLNQILNSFDIVIDDFIICPHSPSEQCDCRKPSPKMILEASQKHNINLSLSFMIGDKQSDVICGENAGVSSHLIENEKNLLYWAEKIVTK